MQDYIDRLYRELLGRPVGPADMEAGQWAGHPESTVRAGILASDEYRNRMASSSGMGSFMGGFMGGFGMPSSSSSALDGIMQKLYEAQLEQMNFMFDSYKEHQLPYERDYWGLAREGLPTMYDQTLRSGEANTGILEAQRGMGDLKLAEEQRLTGPRTDLSLEGIEAQRRLLPYEEGSQRTNFELQKAMNESGMRLLPYEEKDSRERYNAVSDVRGFGLEGVDVDHMVQQSVGDTESASKAQRDALRRDLQGMGISPNDPRYADTFRQMSRDSALNRTQAMNQARRGGMEDDWRRRYEAARL